jgi:putative phosphoribosyl transferase
LVSQLRLSTEIVEQCISQTRESVRQRMQRFRGNRPFPDLSGKTSILVDDGLASGFTMLAAVESVGTKQADKIIIAVPTASVDAIQLLAPSVDKLVCPNIRQGPIFAVADAYDKWYDVSDDEVLELLRKSEEHR